MGRLIGVRIWGILGGRVGGSGWDRVGVGGEAGFWVFGAGVLGGMVGVGGQGLECGVLWVLGLGFGVWVRGFGRG